METANKLFTMIASLFGAIILGFIVFFFILPNMEVRWNGFGDVSQYEGDVAADSGQDRSRDVRGRSARAELASYGSEDGAEVMELGEHRGSGEQQVSDAEAQRLAGATVDTGSGYRTYGQPVRRPNGTVCRMVAGERVCVPGSCSTDPASGRSICRPFEQ